MREKSQIDAMRAAIRGDLERSRARGQSGGLLDAEPELDLAPEPELQIEPEPEPESSLPVGREPVPEPQVEPEPAPESSVPAEPEQPEPQQEPPAAEEARPGFFASLFRRR